jgi:hypothetical protein
MQAEDARRVRLIEDRVVALGLGSVLKHAAGSGPDVRVPPLAPDVGPVMPASSNLRYCSRARYGELMIGLSIIRSATDGTPHLSFLVNV